MFKLILAIFAILSFSTMANADDNFGTAAEAQALVGKVKHALAVDRATTLSEISAKDKKWVEKDLYPIVYDMLGTCLAHGNNAKEVGKNLMGLADADGKEFIKERMELAHSKDHFWQEYRFTDPVTKKVLPKSLYCETATETVICSGIYKR